MGRLVSVTVGGDHVCAVNQRGLLYCWGLNDRDQTGLPRTSAPVRTICPACAKPHRSLTCPRSLMSSQADRTPARSARTDRCSAGGQPEGTAGIGSVGALAPAARQRPARPGVGRLEAVVNLTAGEYSNCARASVVSCWGDNSLGQLGDGNCTSAVALPMQVDLGL